MSTLRPVAAVVVTYHTGEAYRDRFTATLPQVDRLILVDNGSDEETLALLRSLAALHPDKMEVIYNPTNQGLAAAQNTGVERALDTGCRSVLLLDDDSTPDPGMVAALERAYNTLPDQQRTAILAPRILDIRTGGEALYVLPWMGPLFRRTGFGGRDILDDPFTVIASGSLIRAEALQERDPPFRAEFFIDYVDIEYCLYLRTRGWKIVAVREAVLHHRRGEASLHEYGPDRRYSIYRNRVRVWKSYLSSAPAYILYDMVAACWDILRIVLCEQHRLPKLRAVFRGLWDGVEM